MSIIMWCFMFGLFGCDNGQPSLQEQQQMKTQNNLQRVQRVNEFLKSCDNNGGIAYFNMHESCGKYCEVTYIRCKNGMEKTMK